MKMWTLTKKKGRINMPAFYFYHNFYSVFLIMAHLPTSLNVYVCNLFCFLFIIDREDRSKFFSSVVLWAIVRNETDKSSVQSCQLF